MATGSELQEVELVNGDGVDSGDVTEGPGAALVLVIDNERSEVLHAAPVPHLALASAHALGPVDLLNIGPGLDAAEEDDGLLGLSVALDLVGDDQWDLGDARDLVT